jgi:hypothetical protein
MSPGAPKGNKNAFRHGRYTADAIARRRKTGAFDRAGVHKQHLLRMSL